LKKKSIKDIAADLGISKTTVSFVLNDRGDEKNISAKTQKKILDYIKEVNYKPNQIAQSLKKGQTNTIGYLVPDISNTFFARIGRLLEDKLWEKGYHLIIGSTDEDEKKEAKLLDMFVNRQTDALVLASCDIKNKNIKSLLKRDYPMVFFDREDMDIEANYIVVENTISMKTAVQEAINAGAQKIGMITLTPDVYSIKNRIEGYKLALEENGMEISEDLILVADNNNIKQSTEEQLVSLIEAGVDAIVFTNNQLAATSIWAMNTRYPNKVNDVLFVSFDNIDLFDYSLPKVISVAQPIDEIAYKAADMLIEAIEAKKNENVRLELNPKIIVR
jgi:LacI family transcriptional regulator